MNDAEHRCYRPGCENQVEMTSRRENNDGTNEGISLCRAHLGEEMDRQAAINPDWDVNSQRQAMWQRLWDQLDQNKAAHGRIQ